MSVNTKNAYGQISIDDDAIATVAVHTAMECYGIVDMASNKLTDYIAEFFRKGKKVRGAKIESSGDRIFIDLFVIVKYGVSILAVTESLKEAVEYNVEKFTGMIVDTVNVNVIGVKL